MCGFVNTPQDLERDRWTNQEVDISQFSFESVLGIHTYTYVSNESVC